MSHPVEALAAKVEKRLGTRLKSSSIFGNQLTIECESADVFAVCKVLRDDAGLAFEQLVDLCGVDYLDYGRSDWQTSETASSSGFSRGVQTGALEAEGNEGGRFAVVYHLLSHTHNQRVRLRCFVNANPPVIDSVCAIWPGADWYEREAFDLFGILFQGHDDLRRLLTDYGFVGHPFRKDFPLVGEVEMRFDPGEGRVIYEPATTEMRVLVPKVIRNDARYDSDETPAGQTGDEAESGAS